MKSLVAISRQRDRQERSLTFFRRLIFRRNPNLIQSEALLVRSKNETSDEHGPGKKKKKPAKEVVSTTKPDVFEELKVDHSYLVSPYHAGMIASFVLIARNLEQWLVSKHELQIGDGLVAVHSIASRASPNLQRALKDESDHQIKIEEAMQHFERPQVEDGDKKADSSLHVLIIDADSTDLGSGMSCPPAEFLEDSFLLAARTALVDGGMLITNVVSRAAAYPVQAVAQLKKFLEEIYYIEVSEDVNRVLIALPQSTNSGKSPDIMKDLSVLETLVKKISPWGNGPNLREILKRLETVEMINSESIEILMRSTSFNLRECTHR